MAENFMDFNLSENIKRAVADAGYTEPTEIQTQSIPKILEGKDIIGFSKTGSGKTAAFGLPVIEKIDLALDNRQTQAIILCPTRELAVQAVEELQKFSKYTDGLHIVAVYGGQPIDRQLQSLKKGCQIVVGTPGRVMDHMRRHTLKLGGVHTVVLDEADEMLNMGFREDIETILQKTPSERQTVLFSATMPKAILEITKNYQHNPEMIKIENKSLTVDTIKQYFFEPAAGSKKDALSLLLQYYKPESSIVFCNTKKMTDEVCEDLKGRGFSSRALHGDLKQAQRTQVMNAFKKHTFNVLVATDVAARGIDVDDIDIVFNFDLPSEHEYYVHRIGRTGRAGKDGLAFTLIHGAKQYSELHDIMNYTHCKIERKDLPTVSEIKEKNSTDFVFKTAKMVRYTEAQESEKYLSELNEMGFTDREIALALLHRSFQKSTVKKGTVDVKASSHLQSRVKEKSAPRKKRTPNQRAIEKFKGIDMVPVTISIGRQDRVSTAHILGAVAGESGLPGKIMGTIDIGKNFTTIDVPKKYKTVIIKSLNGKTIRGKSVRVK